MAESKKFWDTLPVGVVGNPKSLSKEKIGSNTKKRLQEEKEKSRKVSAAERFFWKDFEEVSFGKIKSLIPHVIRFGSEEFVISDSFSNELARDKIRTTLKLPEFHYMNSIILDKFAAFVGDRRVKSEREGIYTSWGINAMNAELGDIVRFINAVRHGSFEMDIEDSGSVVKTIFTIKPQDGIVNASGGKPWRGQSLHPEFLRPLIGYLEEKWLITFRDGKYELSEVVDPKNMAIFIRGLDVHDGMLRHEILHALWDNSEEYRRFLVEKVLSKLSESQKERLIVNALLRMEHYGWLRSEWGSTFLVDEMMNAYATFMRPNGMYEIWSFSGEELSDFERKSIAGKYWLSVDNVDGLIQALCARYFDPDKLISNI